MQQQYLNSDMKRVVVTGAAGYIGGQTCIELKQHGYHVVGVDRRPMGGHFGKYLDLAQRGNFVDFVASYSTSDAIVHCAGTSLVGPSITDPAEYYQNNIGSTAKLLRELSYFEWHGRFVFSSSAAVYGRPCRVPITELDPTVPISAYGRSKLYCEELISDSAQAYDFSAVSLRYFNACGADLLGRHGQDAQATHIFAQLFQAAQHNHTFNIYGDQYCTRDGTCIRDYIHVVDIAGAHRLAIEKSVPQGNNIYNIGSNQGFSVREIVNAVEQQLKRSIKVKIVEPRAGDPPELLADADRFRDYFEYQTAHSDLFSIISSLQKWYGL